MTEDDKFRPDAALVPLLPRVTCSFCLYEVEPCEECQRQAAALDASIVRLHRYIPADDVAYQVRPSEFRIATLPDNERLATCGFADHASLSNGETISIPPFTIERP